MTTWLFGLAPRRVTFRSNHSFVQRPGCDGVATKNVLGSPRWNEPRIVLVVVVVSWAVDVDHD